ncbi:hypothetical protein BH11VER1_BH11VER1_12230 [soil metagenome]
MSLTLEQITSEAMHLSVASRAELAEKLVESLDTSENEDLQVAWASEAIRRRDDVRAGRVTAISGEQVLTDVRRMLGQ